MRQFAAIMDMKQLAARKYRIVQHDATREKIMTTQLVKRLQASGLGKLKLDSVQQKSIEILLKKVLPDLAAVTHSGDKDNPIEHKHDVQIRPQLSRAEWEKRHVLKK